MRRFEHALRLDETPIGEIHGMTFRRCCWDCSICTCRVGRNWKGYWVAM